MGCNFCSSCGLPASCLNVMTTWRVRPLFAFIGFRRTGLASELCWYARSNSIDVSIGRYGRLLAGLYDITAVKPMSMTCRSTPNRRLKKLRNSFNSFGGFANLFVLLSNVALIQLDFSYVSTMYESSKPTNRLDSFSNSYWLKFLSLGLCSTNPASSSLLRKLLLDVL